MGKYTGLRRHLQREEVEEKRLAFEEIEEILGFDLPKSARKFHSWWANDESKVQAREGWLAAGWETRKPDIQEEKVTFLKTEKGRRRTKPSISLDMSPSEFGEAARVIMEEYLEEDLLSTRKINSLQRLFDFVSQDHEVVGEAKYYTVGENGRVAQAKLSAITEVVWLLEKIDAGREKFLVFGNDRRVPERWLEQFGEMVDDVNFYFIDPSETVGVLQKG